MVLDPYVISGVVYDSEGNVVENVHVYAYNVTKAGYMIGADGITNSSGQYQIDISDQTITTNASGYVNGDKLQLHAIIDNRSICARHTIASGDGGAWSQDLYLHNARNLSFITTDDLAVMRPQCHVSSVIISNITTSPYAVRLYDVVNDNPVMTIEVPANNTITVDCGNKSAYFEGGVCVMYDVVTNDGTNNDLECNINYGRSAI